MTTPIDFEQTWQRKLSNALDEAAGQAARTTILDGGARLSDDSPRAEIIRWTQAVVERGQHLLGTPRCAEVFSACACRYPDDQLLPLRDSFARDGDVDDVLEQLQERFIRFLNEDLQLPQGQIDELVDRGWGLAGRREGETVFVTKIPKSGYLQAYLEEPDPARRRAMYCHCPRVRDAVSAGEQISPTYCYCGAGYYKAMWETILDQPVQVEIISSVLAGDETCTVAIHLPGWAG